MDYSIPKDLTGCDKDKIYEIVRSVKKALNEKRVKADSQLHNLANQELNRNKMKIGDYVIINDGQSDILGSCVIRGDYKYDETKPCPHTRKVEYLSTETKEIPKQDWGTTTSKKLDGWKEFNDIISGVSTTKTGETGLLPTQARKKLSEETYFNEDSITEIENELNEQHQIIFEGPPGTSKTYFAIKFAKYFTENKEDHVEIIQFHPSYNYEDFVEGIRPKIDKKREVKGYEIKDGILKRLATRARYDDSKFVLIIDEINRGKISRIFGELIYLLEYRNEEIRLTYSSDKKFQLPKNLYIIGTMNTADRSIALMDFALRRRFAFFGFKADSEILSKWLNGKGTSTKVTEKVVSLMDDINDAIAESSIGEECQIGQSYFMKENLDKNKLQKIFEHKILPLLKEYYFADKPQIVDIESKFNQVLKNWNVDGN